MLQTIRDNLMGKVALGILALLALTFVFFGVNLNFANFGYAARVDGEDISAAQFENAYRNQMFALAEQGTEIPEQFRSMVREGVLDRMIRETLIDQYLDTAGFEVSNKLVTDTIQQQPDWQVDGSFSMQTYLEALERDRVEPSQYEALQRRNLERFQLQRAIAATAFITPAEYRRYLNLYAEQRQATLAEVDIAGIEAGVEVTEEEILAQYDANPDRFQAPESVDLAYVELRRDAIAADIEISEDELARYYESEQARFVQDEQRRASHILIPFGTDEAAAEDQATALAARAQAGEPFEDLASQYSADTSTSSRGGDLGLLLESQYLEGLGSAVFGMNRGDITGPVRTNFGFHVLRLEDIVTGGALPLADVRNELLQELRLDKSDARYLTVERDLSNALFDAPDIAGLAESTGLEVQTVDAFTRSGGGAFGANQAAIDAVFDPRVLNDRELSDIIELDANRTVVLAVTEYREPALRPLDEVRDDIAASLRAEKAFTDANAAVAAIQAALAGGADMDAAVADLDNVTTRTVTMTRQTSDVDPQVLSAVFQQKKPQEGQARTGTAVTADRRYVVFNLIAVQPGRPESIPLAERDAGKEQLSLQAGSRDYAALIAQLVEQADIVKSEDALARDTLFE